VNKPDQSASVMFQVHTPDDGSIFLSFSVYLDRSHSSFRFSFVFFFSSFFLSFCFALFYCPFGPGLSFSRLFPAVYQCTSPGRKKKVLSASRRHKWLPSTKKANWAPRPLREFPGNYHGKYDSSSAGRELNKYTYF
jgi:hypothetical protein